MPASNFPEYALDLRETLDAALRSSAAASTTLNADARSALRGFLTGQVVFLDGSELHFREFIDLTQTDPRVMYAYHYQDASARLIFRYDNARHRPALPQAEHRHSPANVRPSHAPTLADVLAEIVADDG